MDLVKADPVLPKVVEALKNDLQPTRLFLYGSRSNNKARPDSDYDFVAVVPNFLANERLSTMSRISEKLWSELDVSVQVWVYSQAEFDDWKDEFSSIPETAVNTGLEVELGG